MDQKPLIAFYSNDIAENYGGLPVEKRIVIYRGEGGKISQRAYSASRPVGSEEEALALADNVFSSFYGPSTLVVLLENSQIMAFSPYRPAGVIPPSPFL